MARKTASGWVSLCTALKQMYSSLGTVCWAQTFCSAPDAPGLEPRNQTGNLLPQLWKQWPTLTGARAALWASACPPGRMRHGYHASFAVKAPALRGILYWRAARCASRQARPLLTCT
jgi:hypothetical protein